MKDASSYRGIEPQVAFQIGTKGTYFYDLD